MNNCSTAVALATGFPEKTGRGSPRDQFLTRFALIGKPAEPETSVPQALTLMNGKFISDATTLSTSPTFLAVCETPGFTITQRIEALYIASLGRKPTEKELTRIARYLQDVETEQLIERYSDVFWALQELKGAFHACEELEEFPLTMSIIPRQYKFTSIQGLLSPSFGPVPLPAPIKPKTVPMKETTHGPKWFQAMDRNGMASSLRGSSLVRPISFVNGIQMPMGESASRMRSPPNPRESCHEPSLPQCDRLDVNCPRSLIRVRRPYPYE